MSKLQNDNLKLPPEQQAMRQKCFHPTAKFVEFAETEQSISERFEETARRYPENLAVKTNNAVFTYDELNKTANRVARAILAQSGINEQPVALLFEPGAFIIAAIFGILKTGRIYVPVDPALPSKRAADLLEDSQAKVVLTNAQNLSLARRLAKLGQVILNCDEIPVETAAENLDLWISQEAPSLILYTSGSTGRPKGVLHSQRNILLEARSYTNDIRICSEDRLSLSQSCSFANSIRNIYGALLNGAALFPYDLAADGFSGLVDWLRINRITIFHTLETIIRRVRDTIPPGTRLPELRILRFGGETSSGEDVRYFQRNFAPNCVLMNVIGLTETFTIRRYFVPEESCTGNLKVPLGYAVSDKQVLLLDDTGEQVRAGQIGEIAVRSKYLALGYWQRPDLTRTAFISDPYRMDEQVYLTGDLGMMQPDGCLIHMGRKDFQVKIRGNRVETTEIESAILKLDSVRAAVVHPQLDHAGEQCLIAYIVPEEGKTAGLDIRRALAPALPDYMIPSAVVFLDSLPVVPNGRIDRRALPQWDPARRETKDYVGPRNTSESQLANIWTEALGTPQVGIHDNFFELGGNSLTGLKLMASVRERFHIDAPLRWLFEFPTIAALAARIEHRSLAGTEDGAALVTGSSGSLFPLKVGKSRNVVFFLPGGLGADGEFLVYARLAHHVGQEFSFFGLRPVSAEGERAVPENVEALAAEYLKEVTAVDAHGPYLLVGNCIGGVVAYEMARQLLERGQKIADLVLMDTVCPGTDCKPDLVSRTKHDVRKLAGHYYVQRAAVHVKHLREIPYREKFDYVWNLVKDLPRVRRVRRIQKSYVDTLARYHPRPYRGPVSIIASEDNFQRDPTLGWSPFISDKVHVHRVRGDHESYIREHVSDTARQLKKCLCDAVATGARVRVITAPEYVL